MVFSSLIFIFRFLPAAFILYYLIPKKYKNYCLIILSLIFYSWGEPKYVLIMLSSIFVDFYLSKGIEKYRKNKKLTKCLLFMSILFNIGMLAVFKYSNFIVDNLNLLIKTNIKSIAVTLPLGISFYTFQTLSYTIDVYSGKIKAEKSIINFAAFVTLFPQLIAGPIVKYSDIKDELTNRKISLNNIQEGIEMFIIGLGKKVLLANNIGLLWNQIENIGFSNISAPLAWLGLSAFAMQIYFDFSGYSTMARGLGKMLGFTFPKNFDYPYISRSISEFWRRWHITLGSWFKEYVYIPLGGNRKGLKRQFLNLFIVWFLTGLWHGAEYNFILWGLYFFIFISFEKIALMKVLREHKVISHIYTIIVLLVGWMIFAISDLNQLRIYFNNLFNFKNDMQWVYYINNYFILLILGAVCSTPIVKKVWCKIKKYQVVKTIILMIIFFISIAYLVDSSYNPFLYFRF